MFTQQQLEAISKDETVIISNTKPDQKEMAKLFIKLGRNTNLAALTLHNIGLTAEGAKNLFDEIIVHAKKLKKLVVTAENQQDIAVFFQRQDITVVFYKIDTICADMFHQLDINILDLIANKCNPAYMERLVAAAKQLSIVPKAKFTLKTRKYITTEELVYDLAHNIDNIEDRILAGMEEASKKAKSDLYRTRSLYFELLLSEPRDPIGLYELTLLMRCLDACILELDKSIGSHLLEVINKNLKHLLMHPRIEVTEQLLSTLEKCSRLYCNDDIKETLLMVLRTDLYAWPTMSDPDGKRKFINKYTYSHQCDRKMNIIKFFARTDWSDEKIIIGICDFIDKAINKNNYWRNRLVYLEFNRIHASYNNRYIEDPHTNPRNQEDFNRDLCITLMALGRLHKVSPTAQAEKLLQKIATNPLVSTMTGILGDLSKITSGAFSVAYLQQILDCTLINNLEPSTWLFVWKASELTRSREMLLSAATTLTQAAEVAKQALGLVEAPKDFTQFEYCSYIKSHTALDPVVSMSPGQIPLLTRPNGYEAIIVRGALAAEQQREQIPSTTSFHGSLFSASKQKKPEHTTTDKKQATYKTPVKLDIHATVSDGDCGIHALCGVMDEKLNAYYCREAHTIRQEVGEAILKSKPGEALYEQLKLAIENTVMEYCQYGSSNVNLGPAMQKAVTRYRAFQTNDTPHREQAWTVFSKVLHEHETIMAYIQDNTQQHNRPNVRFQSCLNAHGSELPKLIANDKQLQAAYEEYNRQATKDFGWEVYLQENTTIIAEYVADKISKPFSYLLPPDLWMFAVVKGITAHFSTDNNANIEIFNPGMNKVVGIKFNGTNHYSHFTPTVENEEKSVSRMGYSK